MPGKDKKVAEKAAEPKAADSKAPAAKAPAVEAAVKPAAGSSKPKTMFGVHGSPAISVDLTAGKCVRNDGIFSGKYGLVPWFGHTISKTFINTQGF
jgi:hypothetical protein